MKESSHIYFQCLNWGNMTDNINKISQIVDGNKYQQTSASIVNLTDEGN